LTVDIVVRKEPSYSVISKTCVGPYSGGDMLRPEFRVLSRWARDHGVKTGKWFFYELDDRDTPEGSRRWEACIEVQGRLKAKPSSGIERKELPAQLVASVIFDPEQVAPRLVYHGLEGWLQWRTKFGEFSEAGPTREVYSGDPWTSRKAWSSVDVQVPIRKIKRPRL
jgi:DNA gyrase inhibitor GyrI